MKKEALKLADELDEYNADGFPVLIVEQSANMLRRLVEHIEELENPIMQAISQAFGASQEWQYLTDDEIKEIIGSYGEPRDGLGAYTRELFDKIEAKIREKNEKSKHTNS